MSALSPKLSRAGYLAAGSLIQQAANVQASCARDASGEPNESIRRRETWAPQTAPVSGLAEALSCTKKRARLAPCSLRRMLLLNGSAGDCGHRASRRTSSVVADYERRIREKRTNAARAASLGNCSGGIGNRRLVGYCGLHAGEPK